MYEAVRARDYYAGLTAAPFSPHAVSVCLLKRHATSPSPPQTPDAGLATGVALILVTVLIWGVQFPVAKSAFEHVDPFHLAFFRYAAAVLVLLAVLIFSEGIGALRFDRQAGMATIVGLVGMFGSPALVFSGLSITRPEVAAVIIAVQPSMTAVVLWVSRGRRPDGFSLLCIVVAFLGVFTVITGWSAAFLSRAGELIGNLLILLGALCWVIYTIASERFGNWSVLRFTSLTMLPGALAHLTLVTVLTALGVIATPAVGQWMAAAWQIAFLSVLGVLAAMLMWNAGTKRIGPLNAVLFINLIPVLTFAVRYWQGARFTWLELGGAALVVAALIANNLGMRARMRRERKVRRSELSD